MTIMIVPTIMMNEGYIIAWYAAHHHDHHDHHELIMIMVKTKIIMMIEGFTSLPGTLPLPLECSVFESLFGSGEGKGL